MLHNRLRRFLPFHVSYKRLQTEREPEEADEDVSECLGDIQPAGGFSWLEYVIFLWLGVSMLWAWYVCRDYLDDST